MLQTRALCHTGQAVRDQFAQSTRYGFFIQTNVVQTCQRGIVMGPVDQWRVGNTPSMVSLFSFVFRTILFCNVYVT